MMIKAFAAVVLILSALTFAVNRFFRRVNDHFVEGEPPNLERFLPLAIANGFLNFWIVPILAIGLALWVLLG